MKYNLAPIIKEIAHWMPCDNCPYPCGVKGHGSLYNCHRHWYEILIRTDTDVPWEDVGDELWKMEEVE